MPDRPAPTTSTSRCSIGLRSYPGELVVQRAVLTEQLFAPLVDETGVVGLARMEVVAVVVLELLPNLAAHERRLPKVPEALPQHTRLVGALVEGERDGDFKAHRDRKAVPQQ